MTPLLLLVLTAPPGVTSFSRQPWVQHEVVRQPDGRAVISFGFHDDLDKPARVSVTYELAWLQAQAGRMGVPRRVMTSGEGRDEALVKGLFRVFDKHLEPDGPAVVLAYEEVTRPLAHELAKLLIAQKRDTRAARIELAMAFVEDLAYGVPPENPDWETAGVVSAPRMLLEGYGDCDSKAYLLAGLLSALVGSLDVGLGYPDQGQHMLCAVRQAPAPGQRFLTWGGSDWVLLDATGPARVKPGEVRKVFKSGRFEMLLR